MAKGCRRSSGICWVRVRLSVGRHDLSGGELNISACDFNIKDILDFSLGFSQTSDLGILFLDIRRENDNRRLYIKCKTPAMKRVENILRLGFNSFGGSLRQKNPT